MVPIWILLPVLKIQMSNTTWLLRKWASDAFTGWIFFITTGKLPSVNIVTITECTLYVPDHCSDKKKMVSLSIIILGMVICSPGSIGMRMWELLNKGWLGPRRPIMPIKLKRGWVMKQNTFPQCPLSSHLTLVYW